MRIFKLVLVFLLIQGLHSCDKHETDSSNFIAKENSTLAMDIYPVGYGEPIVDSTTVAARLDEARGLIIIDAATKENNDHSFYCSEEVLGDSIRVIASLKYDFEESAGELSAIEIEFNFKEAIDNLVPLNDSLYYYDDLGHLYNVLMQNTWDTKAYSSDYNCNQTTVLFPDAMIPWGDSYMGELNNSAHYFEWENFSINSIQFDQKNQQLEFSADFEVSIKVLSCGFYEFFTVQNASFSATINNDNT